MSTLDDELRFQHMNMGNALARSRMEAAVRALPDEEDE